MLKTVSAVSNPRSRVDWTQPRPVGTPSKVVPETPPCDDFVQSRVNRIVKLVAEIQKLADEIGDYSPP